MLNSFQLINKYGNPAVHTKAFEDEWMIFWPVPDDVHSLIPHIPKVIYLNKDIAAPLETVLRALIAAELHKEIKTYDGCFNIRDQRGSTSISSHAFGISLDLNASWNPFKIRTDETDVQWAAVRSMIVQWSPAFLQVWRANGWFCGADWVHRIDGMHFQKF